MAKLLSKHRTLIAAGTALPSTVGLMATDAARLSSGVLEAAMIVMLCAASSVFAYCLALAVTLFPDVRARAARCLRRDLERKQQLP
jgi:hypothetical protein